MAARRRPRPGLRISRSSTMQTLVVRVCALVLLAVSTLPVAIVTAVSAAAAGPLQLGPKPATPAFQPPWAANVYETTAPDPDVERFGSTFYAYTTGTNWGNHIGILTSTRPAAGW